MKKEFEMTQEQLDALLKASQPVSLIALQCGMPKSPQKNANAAWKRLGGVMGFDHMSVKGSSKGNRFFTATAVEPTAAPALLQPAEPAYEIRLFMDGDKWCALSGPNLQEGIAGFGDTPMQAFEAFETEAGHRCITNLHMLACVVIFRINPPTL